MPTIIIGRRKVRYLAKDLWSQSQVARTLWPVVGRSECVQRRVRGEAGDRVGQNYLVLTMNRLRVVRPLAKWFVRPDPMGGA